MRRRWLDHKEIRRWLTLRCEHCGHRFRWKRDARFSFGNRDGRVYHGPCIGFVKWKRKAEDRLAVLDVLVELSGVTGSDVREVMAGRAEPSSEGSKAWNLAWSVFRDLEQTRDAAPKDGAA